MTDETFGVLHVYRHKTWGALCSDGFDAQDATVVCREVGGGSGGQVVADYKISKDAVTLWGTEVQCTGDEVALSSCSVSWVDHYQGYNSSDCTTGAYAAVMCSDQIIAKVDDTVNNCDTNADCDVKVAGENMTGVANDSAVVMKKQLDIVNPALQNLLETAPVRLMGNTPYSGMVEISVENVWMPICDSFWSDDDATVICRQLGFRGGHATGKHVFKFIRQ